MPLVRPEATGTLAESEVESDLSCLLVALVLVFIKVSFLVFNSEYNKQNNSVYSSKVYQSQTQIAPNVDRFHRRKGLIKSPIIFYVSPQFDSNNLTSILH